MHTSTRPRTKVQGWPSYYHPDHGLVRGFGEPALSPGIYHPVQFEPAVDSPFEHKGLVSTRLSFSLVMVARVCVALSCLLLVALPLQAAAESTATGWSTLPTARCTWCYGRAVGTEDQRVCRQASGPPANWRFCLRGCCCRSCSQCQPKPCKTPTLSASCLRIWDLWRPRPACLLLCAC